MSSSRTASASRGRPTSTRGLGLGLDQREGAKGCSRRLLWHRRAVLDVGEHRPDQCGRREQRPRRVGRGDRWGDHARRASARSAEGGGGDDAAGEWVLADRRKSSVGSVAPPASRLRCGGGLVPPSSQSPAPRRPSSTSRAASYHGASSVSARPRRNGSACRVGVAVRSGDLGAGPVLPPPELFQRPGSRWAKVPDRITLVNRARGHPED